MARAGTRRRRSAETDAARARVVEAAVGTLKAEGYAGASARAIAERGGFSQGLVFYHFGSVRALLLAALDDTSERRMAAYRDAMAEVRSLEELVAVAHRVYRSDLEEGHVKVLAELIAASSLEPGLAEEVAARLEPWIDLTAETIERVLRGAPLEAALPRRSVAFAVVALYLGLELLTHLRGDRGEADELFAAASGVAGLLGPTLAEDR